MNNKRAIIVSACSYIATLAIGLVFIVATGNPIDLNTTVTPGMILMSMVLATVMTTIGAVFYFKSNDIRAGAMQGLRFGLVATVVAFVFDGLLAAVLAMGVADPSVLFRAAYTYWFMAPMLLLTLVFCMVVGVVMKRGR